MQFQKAYKGKLSLLAGLSLFLVVLMSACGGTTPTTAPVATTAAARATTAAPANTTAAVAATTAATSATTAAGATTGAGSTGGTSTSANQGSCVAASAGSAPTSGKQRLSVATGGTGGVYFPYGGGLGKLWSSKVQNTEATAEATSGSVDNMKFIGSGKADVAFTLADTAFDAFEGKGSSFEGGKIPVCAIAVLYTNYTHIIALDGTGINKVADLKGKKVSVGSAGSGTEIIADRVMEAAGLNPKSDVTRDNLGAAESVAAMKDRKIDAFFWSGGVPTGAITDLVATANLKVKFLANDDLVEALTKKYGPLYFKINIAKDGYKGLEQDVPVIGVANLLTVNAKISEKTVQDLLSAMFDNLTEVGAIHPEAKKLSLQSAVTGSSIAFHPGAVKYYQSKGVMK
jgi:uncharacterized protein